MGALDGVKVVEVGLLVQGPQASLLLGDWGAEVVKVELPGIGDQSRWLPVEPGSARSAFFEGCNRGKRSCTVDLRKPEGKEVFLRLCEQADVVISNFAPGTMERWGLAYEDVAARNQRIVYAVASTFGHRGPDAEREGADLAAQAAGGIVSATGFDGGPLSPIGITIADHIGAQNVVAGVLAALFARERSGEGQRVETSLLGGQIWAQASELTGTLITGRATGRASGGHALIPGLYGTFTTADGHVAIVGVGGPLRARFYELIGRPELEQEFPQLVYWQAEKAAVFPQVDAAMAARTTDEWCALLHAEGIRHAPVRDHAAVVADPGAWENGYLAEVTTEAGPVKVVAPPVRFSATPAAPGTGVPTLGQHTDDVLAELGYTIEEVTALRAAGAV